MARQPADPNKPKKTRAPAKPRDMFLVSDNAIEGAVRVVKGSDLVDALTTAMDKGERLNVKKVSIPAGR